MILRESVVHVHKSMIIAPGSTCAGVGPPNRFPSADILRQDFFPIAVKEKRRMIDGDSDTHNTNGELQKKHIQPVDDFSATTHSTLHHMPTRAAT